ncbi:heme anaerobic degradation radical SAM methyltransferase ChuW/HutW [Chitinilyticum aquatile]|uniref:heme anaerobic degradation radical SAM methyltransferase ChuW/HutW n=1 Tax=Chitinilyticum aquatile TaxID=362520 RepID=UPI0004151129|nr:heme anaerobic degradation radical SAM methyltransferase ChuW/HutW [Chitinilyticum aquatile]
MGSNLTRHRLPLPPEDVQAGAFARRQALMPMWGAQPIAAADWPATWQSRQSVLPAAGSLAYIHIPFCANHCVFCGFYRNGWLESQASLFVERLIAELAHEAVSRPAGGRIDAVYFGGGTPTLLPPADLAKLIAATRRYLPLAEQCEITIEGRLDARSAELVAACTEAGATRFSFGVQTFATALRRRLGRKHDGEQVAGYLRSLRGQTDATLVVDLMFGLPGQDEFSLLDDLAIATTLGMDGLDLYAFNAYPGLPMLRMIEKKALDPLPGLPEQALHYALAVNTLRDAGWQQLSNSHFASGCREQNRYNALIKAGRDCLAFGAGAGGKLGGVSYQVQSDLATYLATPATEKPLSHMALQSPQHALIGQLQGALDQGELDTNLLANQPGLLARLAEWQEQSLLRLANGKASLTTAGRFWGPTITRELVMLATSATTTPTSAGASQ